MNIEELIPKSVSNRDEYIKNIVLDKINFLGIDCINIVFRFKIDKPLHKAYNFIECDDKQLFNLEGGLNWILVTDDKSEFLPRECLLKEWKLK